MDVQTLGDEDEFSASDGENDNNNNNKNGRKSNNNQNNNLASNEIITSADYSDWDDEDAGFLNGSGNVGYFGGRHDNWNDLSDHSGSDRGRIIPRNIIALFYYCLRIILYDRYPRYNGFTQLF